MRSRTGRRCVRVAPLASSGPAARPPHRVLVNRPAPPSGFLRLPVKNVQDGGRSRSRLLAVTAVGVARHRPSGLPPRSRRLSHGRAPVARDQLADRVRRRRDRPADGTRRPPRTIVCSARMERAPGKRPTAAGTPADHRRVEQASDGITVGGRFGENADVGRWGRAAAGVAGRREVEEVADADPGSRRDAGRRTRRSRRPGQENATSSSAGARCIGPRCRSGTSRSQCSDLTERRGRSLVLRGDWRAPQRRRSAIRAPCECRTQLLAVALRRAVAGAARRPAVR